MQRSYLLCCTLLTALLGACEKEKPESKADLLVGKNWQTTALTVTLSGAQTGTTDAYALLPACQKDNFLRFDANKTLEVNEGADVCPDTEPQTKGTWDISADQTKLNLGLARYSSIAAVQVSIEELSAGRLVLKSTVVQPELTTVTVTTYAVR